MLPLLVDALEGAPPGLAIPLLTLLLWVALIGAGSIVWDALP